MPTAMHLERQGCSLNGDAKCCLPCCILNDSCKDGYFLHAGPGMHASYGTPGVKDETVGYASQPACGGYFTPTVNVFTRSSPGKDPAAFAPMAKLEGPQFFGGCLELLCNSEFMFSGMTPQQSAHDPFSLALRDRLALP